jgi:beta-N-acetylhexosaminidase
LTASLEDKIGQMLVFGWQADSGEDAVNFNRHARRLVEEFRVGGLILMGRNVGNVSATRRMIDAAQRAAIATGLPRLFVATDQEGGRVARFEPPEYPPFPSSKQIAAGNKPGDARANAASMGAMLSEVGVNWALMPVLDVNNNPGNIVIGDRSFSDNPSIVAEFGEESILGMQDDAGLMACGKHFPGHGDTNIDSHLALPTIDHPLSRLNHVELPPFRAAIDTGVGAIMTSHILFRTLDSELPATLSPSIISELLRRNLGFDGIVVTDCLEMRGVADTWGSAEAAILAVIAGADMLLACHTESTQLQIQLALLQAVESGRISEARIDEANHRISRAKALWAT